VAVLVRTGSGFASDRSQRHKLIAALGYGLSALSKLGFLAAGAAWSPLVAVIVGDRLGKGIRTAPRDALISLSSARERLGTSFGGGIADLSARQRVGVDARRRIQVTETRNRLCPDEMRQEQLADRGVAPGQPAQHLDDRGRRKPRSAVLGRDRDAQQPCVRDQLELGSQGGACALAFGAAVCERVATASAAANASGDDANRGAVVVISRVMPRDATGGRTPRTELRPPRMFLMGFARVRRHIRRSEGLSERAGSLESFVRSTTRSTT
jgi:hypothetical protein